MSRQNNVDLNSSKIFVPSAYRASEIVIRNHAGKEYDIKRIVADFTITESIYRSTLTLNIGIRDDGNFMEQAALTGHEWIYVVLDRTLPNGTSQNISLWFRVTEYPVFAKYSNNVQVYRIGGISDHAFISKFKKISRAFNGKISDFIQSVFRNDLGYDNLEFGSDTTGTAAFIVPNMEPIDAMHWALRRAFTQEGSPFYLYQTLDGKIHLKSQADITRQDPYKEYRDAKFFEYDINRDPEEAYEERALRILSINSDLSLSKPAQGMNGAFASRSEYIDIATKTASAFKFDYLENVSKFPTIEAYPFVAPNFEIDNQKYINSYDRTKINYIPINSAAFSNVGNYHAPTSRGIINYAQSQLETLDTQQHTIVLNGDLELNCGKVVSLRIPPAIDPGPAKKNSHSSDNNQVDDYLSGNYVAASVVHNFAEEYFIDMKVKRDTSPVTPFAS